MKIVIIGGTGLIGSVLVKILRERGHEAISASRATGINAVTGEGLNAAMVGVDVVVDVSNSPSFEDGPVMDFFDKSTRNLVAAESLSGVKHHVVLSVVGADELPDSGYMRAKVVQENLIKSSGIPFTIVRATQFFEFTDAIAAGYTNGSVITLPTNNMQSIAAEDVSTLLTDIATSQPTNGIIEIAGPERMTMADLVQKTLASKNDTRTVATDASLGYFGAKVTNDSLTPRTAARLGKTKLCDWLAKSK